MFGFFKPRPPQSYHWSVSLGKMVACANTPCKLHPSDVICATQQEAEESHRRMVKAREESAAARNDDDNILGMTDEEYANVLKNDKTHRDDHVISYKTMFIGNQRYALTSNGIGAKCPWCNGTGFITGKDGDKGRCSACLGMKYSAIYSGKPSDMVLQQPVNDNEDRRFHDFVKTHPDEFNDFIIHAMRSGSYLGNEPEKEVYHPWYNKNPKEMMANRPQEALHLMSTLSSQYASASKEWDEMVESDKQSFRARTADDDISEMDIKAYNIWVPGAKNVMADGTIIDARDFTDKKSNERKTAYTLYDGKQHVIVVFFGYPKDCKKGDTQYVQGDVWKVESDSNGRPQHVFGRFHYY